MAKKLRIGINGFGRIGRIITRVAWEHPSIEIVAINSRSNTDIYSHLLKYDSIYGPWEREVGFRENEAITIDGTAIPFYHEDNGGKIPWKAHEVDVVIESSGVFRDKAASAKHLESGAKYVVITAPAKGEDITMIYGINHDLFDPAKHQIISAASCTTTCLAPVAKTLHETFGVKHGTVVTVHAYTNDQHLVDHPHKDESFRRARAAGLSIVPTSTGAAKAIGKVLPVLAGKLDGNALRVPVAVPSILSFVAEVERRTTAEEVNEAYRQAAKNVYPGTVAVSDIGLVSVDYIRSPFGATIDSLSTQVTDGTMVFVQAWYDNEWGYVTQVVNLLTEMGKKIVK